jgi:DNA-binding CsgD family transcriptional regulator
MASIPDLGQDLSPRESEVLSAFCDGHGTQKEVARELGISYRTVEKHMQNAMVKMGARTQQQAVLMWDRSRTPSAFRVALQRIADMDPKGLRADDLGRAARIARDAIGVAGRDPQTLPPSDADASRP